MAKAKRRYCLVIKGRVDELLSAEQRHARFFKRIDGIAPPWGTCNRCAPPTPDFGKGSTAVVSLKEFFGSCVKEAMITYRYRRLLSDDSHCDDALMIDVDPEKLDLHYFIYTVIPRYVEAFDAYRVDYFDERFARSAYDERVEEGRIVYTPKSKEQINQRFEVKRVEIVSFYDELLCHRAFKRSATEVLARLEGKVEYAGLLQNGVYLVGTSKAVSFEEAQRLTREMSAALK
jgi:hypothetical protein